MTKYFFGGGMAADVRLLQFQPKIKAMLSRVVFVAVRSRNGFLK